MKMLLLALVVLLFCGSSPGVAGARMMGAVPAAVHVVVSGKMGGRPLLLVPGYVAPGELWAETVARLGRRYRCHVVTLAGTGGTAPLNLPAGQSYFGTYARALADYVRANQLVRPVLVAHQTGGMMALRAATDYPDLFGGLVLLEALPAPFAIQNPHLTPDSLKLPPRAELLPMLTGMPRQTFLQQQKLFISSWASDTAQQRRILNWADQADRTTWANIVYESMVTDLRPALPRLRVPVLLLGIWVAGKAVKPDMTGDQVKELFGRQFAAAGAGAEVRMSDTAHEFIMLDDLAWTTANIEQYLTAHPAGRR